MMYNYEDKIVSTDMYLKQDNFSDVIESEELDVHITRYDTPQIQDSTSCPNRPWDDNAHLVFDVPKIQHRW